MPDLIKNGHLYIIDAPLFMATGSKQKVFGMTRGEVDKQMKALKCSDYTVTRLKGWGECTSEQLSEICLNPKKEGVILIKGLIFFLFKESKIIHSFYENNNLNLYKKFFDEKELNNNKENINENNNNNNKILTSKFDKYIMKKKEEDIKKLKITYNILKKEEDIYYELPMTDKINVYQYQFLLYPIKIINNSKKFNVKKCTIFLDTIIINTKNNNNNNNFNNIPLTLFNYINFDINNKIEEIFIPIFPLEKIKYVLKVLLKFHDEKKYNYIEIKRFIIEINVFDSFVLDINQEITNYEKDKTLNKLDKIFFSLNVETNLNDLKNLKNFEIFNFYYNNTINLINSTINNNNNNNKINNKYDYLKKNLDNINNNLFDFSFLFSNNECYNYIINKLSKIINNNDYIFIPWKAIENNNNNNIEKEIKGFYIFQTNLQKPNLNINLIRIILIKSIEIKHEIIKLSNDNILINLKIILNKSGLYHIKILKKYEIFFDYEKNYFIDKKNLFNICSKNYFIKNKKNNNINDDIETLYFNFITENKKIFEINNLYSNLYIKDYKKINNNNYNIYKINIIKPFYININI